MYSNYTYQLISVLLVFKKQDEYNIFNQKNSVEFKGKIKIKYRIFLLRIHKMLDLEEIVYLFQLAVYNWTMQSYPFFYFEEFCLEKKREIERVTNRCTFFGRFLTVAKLLSIASQRYLSLSLSSTLPPSMSLSAFVSRVGTSFNR